MTSGASLLSVCVCVFVLEQAQRLREMKSKLKQDSCRDVFIHEQAG